MSGIRNVKKCVACQDKIFVACKKCPKCKAQQPHKDRLVKERKRFAAEEKEWKERIKKNCNGAHVLDSSFKMVSTSETEFVVLDLYPVEGTDVVVEATDVVEEGDYRSNAEGQGEQESLSLGGTRPDYGTGSKRSKVQGVAVSKNPETLTLGGFNKDGSMSSKRRGKRKPQNTGNECEECSDRSTKGSFLFSKVIRRTEDQFPDAAIETTVQAYPMLNKAKLKTELSLIYDNSQFKACSGAVSL
ncbi:hypothetical protein NQZ68_024325 [Dissostichus eleginoides]|nr:hypothetical protein NQZ68_024325 [Dissostichus eleginoides]